MLNYAPQHRSRNGGEAPRVLGFSTGWMTSVIFAFRRCTYIFDDFFVLNATDVTTVINFEVMSDKFQA
jgi:hypothetical protein